MLPENAIEVKNVKKFFKVYEDKGRMLRERIIHLQRNKYEKREVLKGISFDIKKGETVGLIGKNGCGKSTTLKMLTGILRPNEGSIDKAGRVYSLIELGAGFHPDLTGRENIYINASIYGIKAREVDRRLDSIIRFSELEEFIDNPIRTYSSGMYMRLAFAVAINVEADILLVDEILSVGDSAFQEKCLNKLKNLKDDGVTIVIVSHSLSQVEQICDRVIWLKDGKVYKDGEARKVCKNYLEAMKESRRQRAKKELALQMSGDFQKEADGLLKKAEETDEEYRKRKARERDLTCQVLCDQCGPDARREQFEKVFFTKIRMLNSKGNESVHFRTGETVVVEMEYAVEVKEVEVTFAVNITRNDWVYCYGSDSRHLNGGLFKTSEDGKIRFVMDSLALGEGEYYLDVIISGKDRKYDCIHSLIEFFVENEATDDENGITAMPHRWEMDSSSISSKRKELADGYYITQIKQDDEVYEEKTDWRNYLYTPTQVVKIGKNFFVEDCWNGRIIYSNDIRAKIKKWKTLSETVRGGIRLSQMETWFWQMIQKTIEYYSTIV